MIPKIELTLASGRLVTFLVPAIASVTDWQASSETRSQIALVSGEKWDVREEYTAILDLMYDAEVRSRAPEEE